MKLNEDKYFYRRNFKIGLIISLVITIGLFILFPSKKYVQKKIPLNFYEQVITIVDIPPTRQISSSISTSSKIPSVSKMIFIDEPEPLPDIEIKEKTIEENIRLQTTENQNSRGNENTSTETITNFTPHQLLEVLPHNEDNIKGTIKIKLLIGIDGFVKQYEILNNTINSKKMIMSVIDAVLKSKWQPITIEGKRVEYWIEKTYAFN